MWFFAFRGFMTIDELKEKYTYETSSFVEIDGLDIHYCDEGD